MGISVKPAPKESALVPDGLYSAPLESIREFDNSFEPRLGFEFALKGGGEVHGQVIMQSTGTNLSPNSKLAAMLKGLLGRPLDDYELSNGFDIEDLIGTDCHVLVSQGRSKSGKVFSQIEQVFR